MQTNSPVKILITAAGTLLLAPLHAQSAETSPKQGAIIEPAFGVQRIVNECRAEEGLTLCSAIGGPGPIKTKTISLQIPDFKPGDAEAHVYVMSYVHGNGSGGGTAGADEYGVLYKEDVDRSSMPGADPNEEKPRYYFTAIDVDTLEARVTLDLYQVRLMPFLHSLRNALDMGTRMASRAQFGTAPRPPNAVDDMFKYQEQRVSIRGEHLTVEEVLDLIYLDTGCLVNREAETLVLAGCP